MTPAAFVGLSRSLVTYYALPWRRRALSRFYRELLPDARLAFDVGAHVGSRTRSLLASCERVVAIEPQPIFADWLTRLFARDRRVTLVRAALGARDGEAELQVSARHPTVSSLSSDWVSRVENAPGFEHVDWDSRVAVPMTSLDALIETHGEPDFCKLDVEGYEAEILAGLSTPLPLVAFEYLPATLDIAEACVARLEALGEYRYNLVSGETHTFLLDEWCDANTLRSWLTMTTRGSQDSGDIYARRLDSSSKARVPAGASTISSAGNAPTSDSTP